MNKDFFLQAVRRNTKVLDSGADNWNLLPYKEAYHLTLLSLINNSLKSIGELCLFFRVYRLCFCFFNALFISRALYVSKSEADVTLIPKYNIADFLSIPCLYISHD